MCHTTWAGVSTWIYIIIPRFATFPDTARGGYMKQGSTQLWRGNNPDLTQI